MLADFIFYLQERDYPEKFENHGNFGKYGNHQGEIWRMKRNPFPCHLSKVLPEKHVRMWHRFLKIDFAISACFVAGKSF